MNNLCRYSRHQLHQTSPGSWPSKKCQGNGSKLERKRRTPVVRFRDKQTKLVQVLFFLTTTVFALYKYKYKYLMTTSLKDFLVSC